MQAEESEFLVLGAGLAGLAAASHLQEAGRPVLVLDKGRRIGGRCATRRADGFSFDHGAQYVTARTPDFASLCAAARQAGLLDEWVSPSGKTVLSGRHAMRDLPGFLGRGLAIRQEVEITRIRREAGQYQLFAGSRLYARAEKLVLSAPAPQTARLLDGLSDQLAASARLARYDPCWTVLLGFAEPACPPDGAAEDPDGPVSWARWHSRDGRCSLVLQASPDWSRDWLEAPAEQVADTLWRGNHFRGNHFRGRFFRITGPGPPAGRGRPRSIAPHIAGFMQGWRRPCPRRRPDSLRIKASVWQGIGWPGRALKQPGKAAGRRQRPCWLASPAGQR